MRVPHMDLRREILQLLAEHAEATPVDEVAVFMLLNTVAGGHYEDRYSEDAIRAELTQLLDAGMIDVRDATGASGLALARDHRLRLTGRGRESL
ncbi:MAG: hypothetical protein ACYC6M_01275 [Terriglobales bacterium]